MYTADAAFGNATTGYSTGTGNYVVYNGTGTTVTITGLTSNKAYTYDVYEYMSSTNPCYKTPASSQSATTLCDIANNVSTLGAIGANTSVSLSWTNPTTCWSEVMVVAYTSSISTTPSGDGSTYTANPVYGSGTDFSSGYVVYKGAGTSVNVTNLANGTLYYFKVFTRLYSTNTLWSSGVEVTATPIPGSSTTDYFRSKTTGNWNVATTWESSVDGTTWIDATLYPSATAKTITILSGHTVTNSANGLTVDELTIEAGGQLTVSSGVTWTLANGVTGYDMIINGTLLNQGGTWSINTGATWQLGAGATYIHNTTAGASTPLGAATLDATSNTVFRGSSSLVPAISYSGRTFGNLSFESSSGSWTSGTISGSSASSCSNFTLGANVTLNMTYTGVFTVNGNFTNDGTITYGAGTQSFEFAGSGKTIGGSATSINFEEFSLINNASYSALADIEVNTNLKLTSGKISLASKNFTLTNSATITGGSANSYVITDGIGSFRRQLSTTITNYDFPIGSVSNYEPATITFAAAPTAANTLSGRFILGDPGGTAPSLTENSDAINKVSISGYWEISAATATTDAYTGTFTANNFSDIADYNKLHLLKRPDATSAWILDGTHTATSGSNTAAVLSRTGMSGFSQFSVGGEATVALPINILSFSGYKDGSRNLLQWVTASESNNAGFSVERSKDGITYDAIGFVNSKAPGGNSAAELRYNFTDNAPVGTKQYYRLRQKDLDGRSSLSNIVLITDKKVTTLTISGLYPNPTSQNINLMIDAPARDKGTIVVTDVAGRVVLRQAVTVETGNNTIPVAVNNLANGQYLIKLMCSNNCEAATAKFVKY